MVTKLVSEFVGSNAYIIKNNSNEALIIDAGVNACKIKKHLNGEKVVGILLTHLHFDHSYYCWQNYFWCARQAFRRR